MSCIEEEFLVSFGAEDGTVDDVGSVAEGLGSGGDAVDCLLVQLGFADDAAFSDLFTAHFELGFHEDD
jgi:hypothetical protein